MQDKFKVNLMSKWPFTRPAAHYAWLLAAGGLLASSLAHHLFNLWERSAAWILAGFLLLSPLAAWVFSQLLPRFRAAVGSKGRQVLYALSALLLAAASCAWLYRAPSSYQTLTLTPTVSSGQQAVLLEVKAGGSLIELEAQAQQNGWSTEAGILVAGPDALPLQVSFQAPVGAQVRILLQASPQGGGLRLSLGGAQTEVDLSAASTEQQVATFTSPYRSLPGWLFLPFLVLADLFTFSLLFLALFILQEKGQAHLHKSTPERFLSHRTGLAVLIVLASLLHLANALAVPLLVDSDSPSHLQGAVHLLAYGNLDGVSVYRGPGSTFLFAPVLFLFGRNPWGMKALLHLFALATVLLGYRLGWQLSGRRWVAFATGLLIMLLPELYYYANFVMTDLPNLFLVALFCSLVLDAMASLRFQQVLLALLAGSFAVLFRSENILMLSIGAAFLTIRPTWNIFLSLISKHKSSGLRSELQGLARLLLALGLALLPILWWSLNNLRMHGFFGLSNYAGEVFYDGWVYYAEASGLNFKDENSPAMAKIEQSIAQYPIEITDASGAATGWEIYPALISAGNSPAEAFDLLEQATWDSISSRRARVPDVLRRKFRDAFRPEILHTRTFPLPAESLQTGGLDGIYFDTVDVRFPLLIRLQRALFALFPQLTGAYRVLVLMGLAGLFLALYRRPALPWFMLAAITLSRILVPNLLGLSNWRYTIAAIALLVVFGVAEAAVLYYGAKEIFTFREKTIEEGIC